MSKFVESCKKKLKSKTIDYKIKFAEKIIDSYPLNIRVGEELLHFIFFEDIKETDREISNAEIKSTYDKLYDRIHYLNEEKEYRKMELYLKYENQIEEDYADSLRTEKMNRLHNKILSKRK